MSETSDKPRVHKAGLFDIRTIIGALLGLYGLILVLTGLLGSDVEVQNADAINLWCGLGLLLSAAGFVGWARLRPITVPDEPTDGERGPAH